MSFELKMVACGTHDSVENMELCLPVPTKFLFDPRKIRNYIVSQSSSVLFLILFLDLFDPTFDSILTDLGNTKNVFAIFLCGNPINHLIHLHPSVFHISQYFITYKTTSYAIRAYGTAAQKLYASNPGLAILLEQKSNDLKRWLTTNHKIKACHILIIPLNTTDGNLYDFQQRLIELCNNLFPELGASVCTLYDYISSDEFDPNMPEDSQSFEDKHKEMTGSLIKKIAPIQIYLLGNESSISNKWSRSLVEKETVSGDENAWRYDEQCVFVENEPINPIILENFIRDYGLSKQIERTKILRLDAIQNDMRFFVALERAHLTLEARGMVATVELGKWALNYHDKSTEYSTELHTTGQAVDVSMEHNDDVTREISDIIQDDDQQDLQN